MNATDQDPRIHAWLRQELDAVPEPTRAVQQAVDAAAITSQRRGRLSWLRQLLGLDTPTVELGRPDHPEVVLTPRGPGASGGTALRRESTLLLPAALAATLVLVAGTAAWFTLGPAGGLLGGSSADVPAPPEQPLRPLDPPGPDRVIVVDPTEGHFSTIAGAVAAAQAGDLIELRPGRHRADVVIDKDITIAGSGAREAVVVVPEPLADGAGDRLRTVFTFEGTIATLRGLTVRGADHGTAIRINGGAPTLEGVVIDPDGDMATGSPSQPRQALDIAHGASPLIRDSVTTSLSSISDGSTPTFEGGSVQGGCLLIEGAGTSAVVRGVSFEASECPGFSISVAKGAHVLVEASPIDSLARNAGIRVANAGSSAEISGSSISGGAQGVFVGDGAAATFIRSHVSAAETGILVRDASLDLQLGALTDNAVGLSVGGDSFVETSDTDICRNGQNLALADGARVPLDLNRVCIDGTAELAAGSAG